MCNPQVVQYIKSIPRPSRLFYGDGAIPKALVLSLLFYVGCCGGYFCCLGMVGFMDIVYFAYLFVASGSFRLVFSRDGSYSFSFSLFRSVS